LLRGVWLKSIQISELWFYFPVRIVRFVAMIYDILTVSALQRKKQLAVLIDPDKSKPKDLCRLIEKSNQCQVDYFFVGGSHVQYDRIDDVVIELKNNSEIPVVLFPGSHKQVSKYADGILLLSLISGRNPEYLIGQHVTAAFDLKESGLEILPTSYLLIDGGKVTSVAYVSNTIPIPRDKNELVVSTALAGKMLGQKITYMDAGSGAFEPIPLSIISEVKKEVGLPLIIGGGIRTAEKAEEICLAGADVVVVGNALEEDPQRLFDISYAVKSVTNADYSNIK
jgi:phosphoglycerol geranylgeranyltransferase